MDLLETFGLTIDPTVIRDAKSPLSGIIPIFWRLDGGEGDERIEVSCVAGGTRVGAPLRLPAHRDVASRWFLLHSHLTPNGTIDVRATIENGSGRSVERAITLDIRNSGDLAERVRASLRRSATPVLMLPPCDSGAYDYADDALAPWFDRPDAPAAIDAMLARGEIAEGEAAQLRHFVAHGYLTLEGMIAPDLVRAVNAEIDDAVAKKYQGYEYGSSQRIEKLHLHYPKIRELWLHPGVMRIVRLLFASTPRPCQTLTYVFGSQQDAHQDTIHLTPFPAGYMCGVWMALQDVQPNSGELVVYPGSHRLARIRMKDMGLAKVSGDWTRFGDTVVPAWQRMLQEGGFKPVVYRPKAGDVLIWHENLMHAGSIRIDQSLSRRLIVSHVFADGSVVYYDSSGHAGNLEPVESLSGHGAIAELRARAKSVASSVTSRIKDLVGLR